MTPDEARLRESAEAVRDSRAAYDTAAVGNSAALWRRFASASDDLDGIIQPVETTILALLAALSAERERVADMQRRLDLWEPKTTSGSSIAVSSRIGGNNAPLATQKAEGA